MDRERGFWLWLTMKSKNFWNNLLRRKTPKPLYFARALWWYLTPKWLSRRRLPSLLREARQRADWAYICERVDYYCKLQPSTKTPAELTPLGELRPNSLQSAYFIDSYEHTRYFDDRLRWRIEQGDVTEVPSVPSILKSRPIAGEVGNAVVMKLNKYRHFLFLKDSIPFHEKQDRAIFRSNINYHHPNYVKRERFVERWFGSACCDVGVINNHPRIRPEWLCERISEYDHLDYKFVICLEGNDVATNLKWVMSSNSLAVMPPPTYETWFMEGRLIPNYHYVAIKEDYSDLEERLQYYIDHPDEAEAIIRHAHEWIDQFRDKRREKLISLLVLDKYFRQTNQR